MNAASGPERPTPRRELGMRKVEWETALSTESIRGKHVDSGFKSDLPSNSINCFQNQTFGGKYG